MTDHSSGEESSASESPEVPPYLQETVDETVERIESEGVPPATAAFEVAGEYDHLVSPFNDNHDVIDVLDDIREANGVCADELDTYVRYATIDPDADYGEAVLEALTLRSLEQLLYDLATAAGGAREVSA